MKSDPTTSHQDTQRVPWSRQTGQPLIAVHGGYTGMLHEDPRLVKARQDMLALIIAQAEDYLLGRGDHAGVPHTAVETAQYAVELLEDSRLFNAGAGANFQGDGGVRRTASIHDGATKSWGSVEAVPGIGNPVVMAAHLRSLAAAQPESARAGFSNTRLSGDRAAEWAVQHRGNMPRLRFGYEAVRVRLDALLQRAFDQGAAGMKAAAPVTSRGTVGCVVMDAAGNFAAATSTGGTSNNVPGRVGDSGTPAGNFAGARGAVSMTGAGEGIVNLAMASGLVQALDFTSVEDASRRLFEKAHRHHVSCAAIFVGKGEGDEAASVRCTDSDGAMAFAWSRCDGEVHVFRINPHDYYDDAPGAAAGTARDLAADGLTGEYRGFSKIARIGAQRETLALAMTPERRRELEASAAALKSSPPYALVSLVPPQIVAGIDIAPGALDVGAEIEEARASGRASVSIAPKP